MLILKTTVTFSGLCSSIILNGLINRLIKNNHQIKFNQS